MPLLILAGWLACCLLYLPRSICSRLQTRPTSSSVPAPCPARPATMYSLSALVASSKLRPLHLAAILSAEDMDSEQFRHRLAAMLPQTTNWTVHFRLFPLDSVQFRNFDYNPIPNPSALFSSPSPKLISRAPTTQNGRGCEDGRGDS